MMEEYMLKQQSMELKNKELTFTPSIEMLLESLQEILQRLFSMRSFTEQETLNLVTFLEEELRGAERQETNSYLESAVLWNLPPGLSRYTEDVGISLVLTVGNSTSVLSTLLSTRSSSQQGLFL